MLQLSPFSFSYATVKSGSAQLHSNQEIVFPENGLWLITGPSGSGKSTLLSLIKGLSPYYIPGNFTGSIYYKDQLVDQKFVQQKKNEIVYLFQNPYQQIIYQNPHLEFCFTAESQQISFEQFLSERERLEKEFSLQELWSKKTNELSLGQAQRLLLASLLASGPKVLLLDEPTAFLDPAGRSVFYQQLDQLKKKHLVLLVDHHINEVKEHTDGVIYIDKAGQVFKTSKLFLKPSPIDISDLREFKSVANLSRKFTEINIDNLSFSYGKKKPVLKNINLNLKSPDIVVLRGANGSGKSTLLKLLAGHLKPTQGRITKCKNIGYVMQSPEENFLFDTAKEEIAHTDPVVIKKFFAEKDLDVSPFSLSEGEKRRLSLLIHLHPGKEVILYDEPTFGLDEDNKQLVAQSLLQFKKHNVLQIVVSHDDGFAELVADHIYELKEGHLEKL